MFLDTNAIVYYLHDVKPYSEIIENLVTGESLYTSMKVIDEVIYTLTRIKAWRDLGIRRIEELREYIRRHGYKSFEQEIDMVYELIRQLGIIVLEDKVSLQELIDVIKRFKLLPADGIIALTCKHYGIDTILTFDEDFKRVPWLRVLP